MRASLSVVIITKNEAHNIEDCLKSVSFADEMIVVDSESTDDTRERARGLGAKVFTRPLQGFGEQKRFAASLAQGNWILNVDADERVSPELATEIQWVLETNPSENGFWIFRRFRFLGKTLRYGGMEKDGLIRLFRRDYGEFTSKRVHEEVVVEGRVGRLKGLLEHERYPNVSRWLEKLERYSRMEAEHLLEEGRRPNLLKILDFPRHLFKRLIRQQGVRDGIPGILWALFSSAYPVILFFRMWELQSAHRENPRRILVIQIHRIGDAIMALPALGCLRRAYPQARIDFLVEPPIAELLRDPAPPEQAATAQPWRGGVNVNVLPYERGNPIFMLWKIYKNRYDWVVDFLSNPRSMLLAFCSRAPVRVGFYKRMRMWPYTMSVPFLPPRRYSGFHKYDLVNALGVPTMEERPHLSNEPTPLAEEFLNKWGLQKGGFTVLAPTGRRSIRRWPGERWAGVADSLLERGHPTVFISGPGEENQIQEVLSHCKVSHPVFSPKSLKELAGLLGMARRFAGNDGGARHISMALGVPTVAPFGPTHPEIRTPVNDSADIITADIPCLFCEELICPLKTHACMTEISEETVLSRVSC